VVGVSFNAFVVSNENQWIFVAVYWIK
jgi:hypothetical protein